MVAKSFRNASESLYSASRTRTIDDNTQDTRSKPHQRTKYTKKIPHTESNKGPRRAQNTPKRATRGPQRGHKSTQNGPKSSSRRDLNDSSERKRRFPKLYKNIGFSMVFEGFWLPKWPPKASETPLKASIWPPRHEKSTTPRKTHTPNATNAPKNAKTFKHH